MIFPTLAQLATQDVVTIDASRPLSEAVQLMNEHHIRDVIVTDKQRYSILTARELIDFQIRKVPLSTPLHELQLNIVPQMLPNASVMKALMVIQNHPDNHVCLINEDKELIGIVSYSDLAASLQPDQLVQSQPVGEVVRNKPFLQVEDTDDLQIVFQKMHQLKETAAIVMHQQQAVGMITQTDVISLLNQDSHWQKPITDYMTTPLITVDASASVQYALAISREHHIKHVVIQEQQQVLGVLHQKDLVSLVYQSLHQRFENENQQIKQEMDLLKAGPVVSVMWKMAPGWPVKYVTPNIFNVLGYQVSEVVSSRFKFIELIHPDDLALVSEEVENGIANNVAYWEQRYRLLSKQGKWHWFYDYSQPVYGAGHQVKEIFGYLLDQTHLVETEQALRQSELQYRGLFELYPLATVLFDPLTQLPIRFNKKAYQQLGYSAEVFARLRIADYEVVESEQKIQERIAKVLAEGSDTYETQHRCHSGKVLDISVTAKMVKLNDQSYLLAVFEDITALKASQNALEVAHQLTVQASEEKSRFLAYLSHEIRTPMAGILGLSELAQTAEDATDSKKILAQITQAGQQIMSLMNDLLDLSKMEANKLTLSTQPMALNALIEDIMVLANGIKTAKQSIGIEKHYDDKLPSLFNGDSQRLRQVLMNLLSNAIKFTEQGQVRLEISLTTLKNDQAWVKFAVSDTGIGMSPAELKHLFKPYHQGKFNKQHPLDGTGLGLAISQELVQLMNGSGIEVSSEVGKGSCFAFELPLTVLAQQDYETKPLSTEMDYKQLQGQVLVAEDEAINQQVIRQQLEALGIDDIILVSNGKQAVEQAQRQAFDLVLMDLNMPVENGFEASQRLQKLYPELPIIALSAADTEQDRQLAKQAGMKHYFVKPIALQTLYSTISPYLKTIDKTLSFEMTAQIDSSANDDSPKPDVSDRVLIDCHRGVQQLNGNQSLYLKLLRQFLTSLNGEYSELANGLAQASKADVSRDALAKFQAKNHSMKGVAANLALMALYEVSQQIDIALKQHQLPNNNLIEQLKQLMMDTKQAIQNQLDIEAGQLSTDVFKDDTHSDNERLSEDALLSALHNLLKDLTRQRYIDVQQLHPLWISLPESMQQTYASPLIEAIENFEFEQAIQLVNALTVVLKEEKR